MSACSLLIGDHAVLDSPGGPPEVEYALFDAGHMELQSDGPGTIRELGYRTTAGDALERLEACGVDAELVEETRVAMTPKLVHAYARGPAVRRVANLLGACELFEGKTYDAQLRRYAGAWLDLSALAVDLKLLRAGVAMQAVHLAALLAAVPARSTVLLSTIAYTRGRRPGERTYKRVPLEHVGELPSAIAALARDLPQVQPASGPTRSQLLQAVEAHAAALAEGEAKTRALTIARTLAVREPPARGPLADAELWALELALSQGELEGIVERLDAIERARGRLPGTLYLRARAALATRAEDPRAVAERVAALSQSMTHFFELELLAAEAWMAAGDARQAKAFARDLVDNPGAPDDSPRARARAPRVSLATGPRYGGRRRARHVDRSAAHRLGVPRGLRGGRAGPHLARSRPRGRPTERGASPPAQGGRVRRPGDAALTDVPTAALRAGQQTEPTAGAAPREEAPVRAAERGGRTHRGEPHPERESAARQRARGERAGD